MTSIEVVNLGPDFALFFFEKTLPFDSVAVDAPALVFANESPYRRDVCALYADFLSRLARFFQTCLRPGTFVFQVLMTVLSTECGANVRERVWQMCTSGERRVENGTTKVVPVNEGSDRNGFLTWGADE